MNEEHTGVLTGEQIYEMMAEMFGDRLANPVYYPKQFDRQLQLFVIWYKNRKDV